VHLVGQLGDEQLLQVGGEEQRLGTEAIDARLHICANKITGYVSRSANQKLIVEVIERH
jgi:hypothetical protein